MRQSIQREVLKSRFVPNTAGAAGTRATDSLPGRTDVAGAAVSIDTTDPFVLGAQGPAVENGRLRDTLLRTGSTIFLAVLGEKAFARAMSQRRVPAALLGGSLAAGTAYVQGRHARGARLPSERKASKRSALSVYAAMGLGLGLGAMFVNRRRG